MKFKYLGKNVAVLDNGIVEFWDLAINEVNNTKNIMKFSVNTYRDFLSVLRKHTYERIDKSYYTFMDDDYLFIATKSLGDKEIKAALLYKFENQNIKDILYKIINPQTDNARLIVGEIHNSFNFLTAIPILETILVNADLKYRSEIPFNKFKIKSKNGKVRDIIAPHEEIKKPLKELNVILQKIFDKINIDFQVAYKKGKNIKDNADIHVANKFIFNIDLKDFYPSCKRELVQKYMKLFFKNSANSDIIEKEFLDIILDNDALFIGSPISGTIANAIISKPVKYLKNISKNFGMEFSVYADDMTFSSERFISKKFIEGMFNLAFTRYNLDNYFILNDKKSHGMSQHRRRITGVSVNDSDETTVSRKFYRILRVKLHKLLVGDQTINLQKLRGQIAFATMIDDSKKIARLLVKYENIVKQHKLLNSEKYEIIKGGI